jgi:tetratricopeptide (TPR) repeat protein
MSPATEIALFAQLRDDLGFRRIGHGMQTLERLRPEIEALGPGCSGSGIFLGLVAQWVDAGFDGSDLLVRLLAKYPPSARAALPLAEYMHLRMAEGVIEMSREDLDRAAVHFRFVQSLESEVPDAELLAIANFWTGRCLRKTGQYDEALVYTIRGEELALSCGYLQMAAIMQMTRSWLAFQKGNLDEAVGLLRRAEDALSRTDDYPNRGNVQSAHGRIARRQGRYEHALEYFEKALAEFRMGGGGQLQLARTLQNLAFVKRLLALRVQKELDLISASRRTAKEKEDVSSGSDRVRERRLRIEAIRSEAAAHLEESMAIYARHNNHRGIAGGHINRGFLRLDAGDLDCAAAEAAEAFRHGEEKHDYFVMARARTLQCIVENAAVEEQIGNPARHRENAKLFAREAVEFAGRTQNRRLLARAYVWQGLTLAAAPDAEMEAARRCCDEALAQLQPEAPNRQYVWEDLESLKAAVMRAGPVDPLLRAWSAGIVQNRSFQQITEEFARLVIPRVYEREGRKIARVAEKLSISPKKVRRILRSVGLPKGRAGREESR